MNQENETTPVVTGDDIETTAELQPSELSQEWEKLAARAKHIHPVIKMAARTDLGRVRENNEDKFDFFEPEDPDILAQKGLFYAVADGMGGHAAGQIASEMALKRVIKAYYEDSSPDVVGSLTRAVFDANKLIYDAAQMIVERSGMGTTLTAVVIRADTAYFVQVGDSRAYLIRGRDIRQITEDHSWIAEQVRRGVMTEEEARLSPFRNVITRSLGNLPVVEPDVFAEEIQPGDTIVLCSDGLSGSLSETDIRDIVAGNTPSQAAMDLIDAANERGGNDNITAMIVVIKDIVKDEAAESEEIYDTDPKPDTPKKRFFGFFR
ncbi:MAG TPA: Stp1/IreP family PP2C-type Ser/Thr phosphatase [Armatimonadota bacterium]|nr:Stp1/IreP family PP2C-type Ser/Thr phosphatase [Armatimonadota bacterium]